MLMRERKECPNNRASGTSRKHRRTIKQLHANLVILGYEGAYSRVVAFARDWKAPRRARNRSAAAAPSRALPLIAGSCHFALAT
jgi:hypothetical protein